MTTAAHPLAQARLPRLLHPAAWWLWAIGLGTAASRTTNPLLLLLAMAAAGYVVAARRTDAPWARSYAAFVRLALTVLLIRVLLQILFGGGVPGHTLVRLPQVPLPSSFAGLRIGGDVTVEGTVAAAYDGLRLAAILVCVGAANALASPARLLRVLPAAIYEIGVAVTVALTFAPQAVVAAGRVRAARRLRGRTIRGLSGLRGLVVPVLEDGLERSLDLAAAMDTRGFGRRAGVPARERRLTAALTVSGLLAVCASTYGLLDSSAPTALGLPLLAVGAALAAAGLALAGRRTPRTRYRPDPWALPEWLVVLGGVLAAAAVFATDPGALDPSTSPLVAPTLPLLPVAGLACALLPAWAAPEVPAAMRTRRAVAA
jgi:energy-coupling factor transport system permease protein